MISLYATLASVLALLGAEYRESQRLKYFAKPLASAGFIGVALQADATSSSYGRCVLLALICCWLGDILLIPKGSGKTFLGGLAAFLIGHLVYTVAFMLNGIDMRVFGAAITLLAGAGLGIAKWLIPHVKPSMQPAVLAYIVAICVMAAASLATSAEVSRPAIAIGALLFLCSDLAVARQRFIHTTFMNKLWGLPLYYAGQVILAYTL